MAMSFCTRCGRPLSAGTAFCTGCGAPQPGAAPPGEAGAPPPDLVQSGPRRPRPRPALVAVAVVIVVAAGGGAAAWRLAGSHTAVTAAAASRPAGRSAPARVPAGPAPAVPPSSAGPEAASSPAPTAAPAGVPIAPAAAQQPGAAAVSAFVARYFTAINQRDYPGYAALFAPGQVPSQQQFRSGYESTTDSGTTLAGLTPTAAGWAARVTFVSHQDPADSATGSACTSWDITLYLGGDGSTYLIEPPPPGYHASDASCS
jgi:hypothetical protein